MRTTLPGWGGRVRGLETTQVLQETLGLTLGGVTRCVPLPGTMAGWGRGGCTASIHLHLRKEASLMSCLQELSPLSSVPLPGHMYSLSPPALHAVSTPAPHPTPGPRCWPSSSHFSRPGTGGLIGLTVLVWGLLKGRGPPGAPHPAGPSLSVISEVASSITRSQHHPWVCDMATLQRSVCSEPWNVTLFAVSISAIVIKVKVLR